VPKAEAEEGGAKERPKAVDEGGVTGAPNPNAADEDPVEGAPKSELEGGGAGMVPNREVEEAEPLLKGLADDPFDPESPDTPNENMLPHSLRSLL
jgi:hypothetical protein